MKASLPLMKGLPVSEGETAETRTALLIRIAAGSLAGFSASFMGLLFVCIAYAMTQRPFVMPFRLVAVGAVGEAALLPSMFLFSVSLGIVIQAVAGSFLGGLFGLITQSVSWKLTGAQGLLFGVVLWAFLRFVYFPLGFNLPVTARMPEGIFAIGLCLYGAALSLLVPFARQIHRHLTAASQE